VVLALSVDPAPPRRAPSAAAPIAVPGPPDRLAVAGGRVWVLPRLGAALIAVDPRSHRVREYQVPAFFGAGGPFPGLAAGPLGLWVANADPRNGGVDRVDLATGRSRAHARVPRAQAVAVGSDAVWVAHQTAAGRGELVRVSDAGERSPSRVSAGREPVALALAFGSLWVADRAANAVLRIDPVQRRLLARVPVGRGPAALAPAGGRVWVANLGARTLTAIDPATNEVVGAPVRLGKEIEDVAGLRDTLWVAAADSTVTRLEARTGAVIRSLDTLPAPLALAADARGGVWVGSAREQRVTRIDAS
jgi:DNA-binding beta-propeller fold protein YncE